MSLLAGNLGARTGGNGPAAFATFDQPVELARGSDGSLYITDGGWKNIRKLDPTGRVSTIAGPTNNPTTYYLGESPYSEGLFENVDSAIIGPGGNLTISEPRNGYIRSVTSTGVTSTYLGVKDDLRIVDGARGTARAYAPHAMVRGDADDIYFLDTGAGDALLLRHVASDGAVRSTKIGAMGGQFATRRDGNASVAVFKGARSMARATDGSFYIAESTTVRRLAPDGLVTTVIPAPDNPFETGLFNDIHIAPSGKIFVSTNFGVAQVREDGTLLMIAGKDGEVGMKDGVGQEARFNNAWGLADDGKGGLYVADNNNGLIRQISASGGVSIAAGVPILSGTVDGAGANARFKGAGQVVADCSGNFYWAMDALRRITPAGQVTTLAQLGSVAEGLSIDESGMLHVGMQAETRKFSVAGVPSGTIPHASKAIGADGTLYYASPRVVWRVPPSGSVQVLAGTPGSRTPNYADGVGTDAQFTNIADIAVDKSGNVYVVETNYENHTMNHRFGVVRKITPAGVVSTFAGSPNATGLADGTGSAARFRGPTGVTTDAAGNVYVADTDNHAIRKITPSGVVTTIAGNGKEGFMQGAPTGSIPTPYQMAISGNTMAVTTRQGVILIKGI